jgi:hypothetical protein
MIDDKVEQPIYIRDLQGMFETVDAVPTAIPKNLIDQIKFYKSGTTYRIYIFDAKNGIWRYAALT